MEKKNTVLLTVIAVATLLVAVVGATFAYFTATTSNTGEGTATKVDTRTTIGGSKIDLSTVLSTGDIQYPGGYVVNGAEVVASKTEGSTDEYTINYTLNGTITNNTDTTLNYKVYQANSKETTAFTTPCVQSSFADGTNTHYTYAKLNDAKTGLAAQVSGKYESSCVVNASITGTEIASGTVAAKSESGAGSETITVASTDKASMVLNTADKTTTYYYLVVEYPETGSTQTPTPAAGDVNAVSATLTSVTNAVATQKTA